MLNITARIEPIEEEYIVQGSRLYVGNLKYSVTNEELEQLFSIHGVVKQVNVIDGKGFGFVEMSSQKEAEAAKDALNDTDFRGRTLRIDEAHPPRPYRNRERRDFGRYNNGR